MRGFKGRSLILLYTVWITNTEKWDGSYLPINKIKRDRNMVIRFVFQYIYQASSVQLPSFSPYDLAYFTHRQKLSKQDNFHVNVSCSPICLTFLLFQSIQNSTAARNITSYFKDSNNFFVFETSTIKCYIQINYWILKKPKKKKKDKQEDLWLSCEILTASEYRNIWLVNTWIQLRQTYLKLSFLWNQYTYLYVWRVFVSHFRTFSCWYERVKMVWTSCNSNLVIFIRNSLDVQMLEYILRLYYCNVGMKTHCNLFGIS